MKNLKLISLLVLLSCSFITTIAAAASSPAAINLNGSSNTALGDYQIKELNPVTQFGQEMRTFEFTYSKAEKPVMIYLDKRAKCIDYIVRSKNLEVKYCCDKTAFGASLITGKFRKYDPRVNESFLSYSEFNNQKQISEGNLEIPVALGLIASYYPNLLISPNLLD